MEGRELVEHILSLTLGIFGTALIISNIGWRRAAKRVRELEARLHHEPAAVEGSAESSHLAQQVEVLTAQVDRLIDGQDFLARMIAERTQQRPESVPEPRVSTPR